MQKFLLALKYFSIAYLIGTAVGFLTYYINIILMWISLFTIMPALFGYFFYIYLKNIDNKSSSLAKETNLIIILWILLSFILDGLVYIAIVPLFFGYKANWTFFIDQSPWIWLNYATLILIGHISRYIYKNNSKKYNREY